MGFDYSAVDGPASHRLSGREVAVVVSVLHEAGLIDAQAWYPPVPASMEARHADPSSFPDDEDWPFVPALPPEEAAFFGFRSPDPGRVPLLKLRDNEPFIVTPEECQVLDEGIADVLAGHRRRLLGPAAQQALRNMQVPEDRWPEVTVGLLEAFGAFCRECRAQGGFWTY